MEHRNCLVDYEHRIHRLKLIYKVKLSAIKRKTKNGVGDSSIDATQNSTNLTDVVGFVVEDFRFSNSYRAIIKRLPVSDRERYESMYNFHNDKVNELLNEFNLKLVCFDNIVYDEGLPVSALNLDEFSPLDELIISQTIEPAIINQEGHAIKFATVILDKKTS